ncbi:MAG: hypothetical protein RL562_2358 [Planctomycetota bacterium]
MVIERDMSLSSSMRWQFEGSSRVPWWLVATLTVLTVGCGKETTTPVAPPAPPAAQPAPAAPAPEAPVAAPAAASPVQAAPRLPAAPPLQASLVQALLDRWVQAQNEGDFEGYAMLYAERFQGIKRSGRREKAFARKGWIADRKRMFGKAMKVDARDVAIATGVGAATVTFTQEWQSGSYRDVGPKQLVVVREGTELRIAREEMLASEVIGADPVGRLDPADFAFVSHEDAPYVLLARGKAGMRARGRLKLHSADSYASASRRVLEADVAADWKPWLGRAVTLYGVRGKQCHGQVVQLVHLARVEPHFGTRQSWTGEMGSEPMTQPQIADDVWDLGQGGLFLAGRVVPAQGSDCRGVFWARADDRAAVTQLAEATPDPQLLRLGLPALRKLRGWSVVQKEYAEMVPLPRPEHWDRFEEAQPRVVTFRTADGRRLLWMHAVAGSGCGDFFGEFWALWEVQGEGENARLRLLSDDRDPGRAVPPRAAVDLDGDGKLELIGPDAVLQPAGPTWRPGTSAEVPSMDCPC